MTFKDTVIEILNTESTPMSPQEIREQIKSKYPSLYKTESHKRNVDRGNYQNLDHALLAQIYGLVRSNDMFYCDRNYKPFKVSTYEETHEVLPIIEDYEKEEGEVYVLKTNTYTKEGKEILKIGFTTQSIQKRINQLYTTGVPFQFEVHSNYTTKNHIELEKALHKLLKPFQLNKSREFFTEEVLEYIEKIVDIHKEILNR